MKFFLSILLSTVVVLQAQDCPDPTRGVLDPETCTDCQCAVRPGARVKCDATPEEGQTVFEACLDNGCCYEEKTGFPSCYLPRDSWDGPTSANCSIHVDADERVRKGWVGISREDCACVGGCFNDCEPGTIWCYQPPEICTSVELAVVLVVDGSGSIDSVEYEQQRNFMREFVTSFSISPNMTQIGIVEFESVVDPGQVLNIADVNDEDDVLNFINNTMMPCPTAFCLTNTAAAIETMIDMIEDIDDKEKVAIVLTDGISNVGNLTAALENVPDDVLMYSVGIDGAVMSELLQIAMSGKNPAGAAARVESVDDFDELSEVIDSLREIVCM